MEDLAATQLLSLARYVRTEHVIYSETCIKQPRLGNRGGLLIEHCKATIDQVVLQYRWSLNVTRAGFTVL